VQKQIIGQGFETYGPPYSFIYVSHMASLPRMELVKLNIS